VLEHTPDRSRSRTFVSYRKSTAEARDALREADVSYAGEDGRVYVRAPGIMVDRDVPRPAPAWDPEVGGAASLRNPFAKRASRVPRWLLLHPGVPFSISELASAIDLNPAAVSRVVRALEDAAIIRDVNPHNGGRSRRVRLERPSALLEAWLPHWERRRIRQRHWDIGVRDVRDALMLLRDARERGSAGWVIGGLAGAAAIHRAVEPADVLVWTSEEGVAELADTLQPEPGPRGRGSVRIAVTPDSWTLSLGQTAEDLPVADPVQLWLDCASEGERALVAAEAVARASGWS